MPRSNMIQSDFKVGQENVEVEITGTADWAIVEIYSLKREYPLVALQFGQSRQLGLEPDEYSFDFHYQSLAQASAITAEVTRLSDGNEKTKTHTALAGKKGLTSIYHDIDKVAAHA